MEILSRLPVRSILRFKCVSKPWGTLISGPYFKMTHLNHAKNDQNSKKPLISQRCPETNIYYIYCLPLSSSVQPVENVQKLDFPLISRPFRCAIQGSCDGLVIICVNENIDVGRNIRLLWNPSIGESVVLPHPELPMNEGSRLGFVYDSTSGDYKILKIHTGIDGPVEILALKSGSWRIIDKHPRGIHNVIANTESLPFVNEAFHWIGFSREKYYVVSFKYFK
ncbi:F-box/kelch-repeat protein At3g23880-like [Lycium ferocissimum]|uniref:F-box/kelch-repeat protein At3g23880-like n=1 Tax=Lycium ferocissimum TaxID=112874 RepID=UPI0028167F82|nr:F-box/kelch-repeat protein At3g23880-like [Lycium ferocissimum]